MRISPEEWGEHLRQQKAVEGREVAEQAATQLLEKGLSRPLTEGEQSLVKSLAGRVIGEKSTFRKELPKGMRWGGLIVTDRDELYCICGQLIDNHSFDIPGLLCPFKPYRRK